MQHEDRMNDAIDNAEDSPWMLNTSSDALSKNRYSDIMPWEKSRIRLRVVQGTSDYINASPIKLLGSSADEAKSYIACQVNAVINS